MVKDRILLKDPNQFIEELALMGLEQSHILSGSKIPYQHIVNGHEIDKIIHSHGIQELGLTQIRILQDEHNKVGWCADIHLHEQTMRVRWIQGGEPLRSSSFLPIFGGRHGK